jgi:hypothetical protein
MSADVPAPLGQETSPARHAPSHLAAPPAGHVVPALIAGRLTTPRQRMELVASTQLVCRLQLTLF